MQVRRAMHSQTKTQTQVTPGNERYVSLHPQAEEFTLLTEQINIVEVLRQASSSRPCRRHESAVSGAPVIGSQHASGFANRFPRGSAAGSRLIGPAQACR